MTSIMNPKSKVFQKKFLDVVRSLTKSEKTRQISRPIEYQLIYYAAGHGRKETISKYYKIARNLLDNPNKKVKSLKAFKAYEPDFLAEVGNVEESNIRRSENIREVENKRFKSVAKEYRFESDDIGNKSFSIVGYSIPKLLQAIKEYQSFKVSFHFNVRYLDLQSEDYTVYGIILTTKTVNNKDEIYSTIKDVRTELMKRIADHEGVGSGKIFDSVVSLIITFTKFQPFKGGSYIELPEYVKNKKCCINIQNDDNQCLVYCVLYHMFKNEITKDPQRVSKYKQYLNIFDWSKITFPVKMGQLNKVEELIGHGTAPLGSSGNEGALLPIGINVYFYEDKHVSPLRITKIKDTGNNIINLLLMTKFINENENIEHFVYISNLDVLVSKNKLNEEGKHVSNKSHVCQNCLHCFSSRMNLLNHRKNGCDLFEPTKITMPKVKDGIHPVIQFKNFNRTFKAPVAIYGDFETLIVKHSTNAKDPAKSGTQHLADLPPCSYGFNVVSIYEELNTGYQMYRGENVMDEFINNLLIVGNNVAKVLSKEKPMIITEEEEATFKKCDKCHICKRQIIDCKDKVRDHDHVTGLYIGCAHNACNLNRNYKDFKIPVYFHNMKGFDGHLIIQALRKRNFTNIDIIAQNFEKYMCIQFANFIILDSFAFLASSLDTLAGNLLKGGMHNFTNTLASPDLTDEQKDLIVKKGVYPYEYIDSFKKFDKVKLPGIDKFYSSLSEENITKDQYGHALEVWDKFNIKNLGEYHDLYLKTDVLLLTDIFETFRTTAHTYYGLDPANGYFTLPNYAWDAMLKFTKAELEQITDIDMYLFCEQAIRGGVSMITHRHAEANNKYMASYDAKKESSYIMYLDANNLYGEAMSHKLPVGNFEWVNMSINDLINYDVDGDKGLFVKCDLKYPSELHDLHNNYPLAPESRVINKNELSPYQVDQTIIHEEKHNDKIKKLVPNLYDKKDYVCHIKNLQYYIKMGLIVTEIKEVLEFDQSAFLKPYIDFNTQKRTASKNDFEKDLYKLMNNAVFGKTMENVRNHVDISIITDEKKFLKQVAKPQYENCKIYSVDMVALKQVKREVKLNKPVYVGGAILDLSKLHMYKFHYDYYKPKYGDNATLLFTDTDSLCYHVKTEDIYKDMKEDINLFDQSDYSLEGYRSVDNTNKKVIGKFKDETSGVPIVEFVGLRSKMYSILLEDYIDKVNLKPDNMEKKTGKGIKKSALKRDVQHADYKRCLFGSTKTEQRQLISFNNLRSINHEIGLYRFTKVGLSCSNDKQYLLNDGITSLSYGHYKIKNC